MSEPHFMKWAEEVAKRIDAHITGYSNPREVTAILAQANDILVAHAIKSINTAKMRNRVHTVYVEQAVKDIPDLTEWPTQEPK